MKTGLVSVTFRQLSVAEIIKLAKQAGLDGIEWGSDIHCPPNDLENAKNIAALMEQNHLDTISYGSYYKLCEGSDFDGYLATAIALKAPNIRVWAGAKNSENSDDDYFSACVNDAKEICKKAARHDISVSFEYHGGTLTNTQSSTIRLLNAISMDNNFSYWQPLANTSHEQNLENIKELSSQGKLKNIHMYQWDNGERLPLERGAAVWAEYIATATANAILLEFVKDDSTDCFLSDVKTLKKIIST